MDNSEEYLINILWKIFIKISEKFIEYSEIISNKTFYLYNKKFKIYHIYNFLYMKDIDDKYRKNYKISFMDYPKI